MWNKYIIAFKEHLILEKNLAPNTVEAYIRDVKKVEFWCEKNRINCPTKVNRNDFELFLTTLIDQNLSKRSCQRIISASKTLFKFLVDCDAIQTNPLRLIEAPKAEKHLPDTLSVAEIERLIDAVDLSTARGHRNRALLELLYGCGLRVSEAVNLKYSDIYADEEIIRVTGKGDKTRLVPIGTQALKQISLIPQRKSDYIFVGSKKTDRKSVV